MRNQMLSYWKLPLLLYVAISACMMIVFYFFQNISFKGYLWIPFILFISSVALLWGYTEIVKSNSQTRMQIYLLLRLGRMVLALLFLGLLIYFLHLRPQIVSTLLTFAIVYFLYLIYETWHISKIERFISKE